MIGSYLKRYISNIYRRQLIYRDIRQLNPVASALYDELDKGDTRDLIKLYE